MDKQLDRSNWAESIWSGETVPDNDQVDTNIALVKRFFEEVWNKGNLSLVDDQGSTAVAP